MDRMFVRNLKLRCIIGTRPRERKKKQKVIINLALDCDLAQAGRSDRLADTVNYKDLTDRIAVLVEKSEFFLLERLADRIADLCLKTPGVRAVTVCIDKPAALKKARSVAVEILKAKAINNPDY